MLIKIVIIIITLNTLNSYSQNTSQNEYQYMTKGILFQIENGLDLKKGYSLRKFSRNKIGKYTFTFNMLIRDEKKDKIAGIIVSAHSKVSGKTYIKAIPFGNSNKKISPMFSEYYDSVDNWDGNMTAAYSMALTKVMSDFIMNPNYMKVIIQSKKSL